MRRPPPEEAWVSPPPGRGGGVRVAVAYPNSYWVGMSNLGYQAVLRAFLERPGFDVRRVFWEGKDLRFPDGGRTLSEFDLVALSVSYQPDLVHLPRMLEAGRVSPSEKARPLLLGGGVALTINPEPAAPFLDVVVAGDSEPVLPSIMESLGGSRSEAVERLAGLQGIYLPSRAPSAKVVRMAFQKSLDDRPARPAAVSSGTEFGSLYLLEVSRGCGAGCAFCAASAVCGPVRFLGMERFARELETALRYRRKVGLVGTAVSYHPRLLDMADAVHRAGGTFSPSSIRLERLSPQLAERMSTSGHRTVSLAPEAGSEPLRRTLGKGFDDGVFLRAVSILQDAGIPNLKLYFIVGLPGERDEDVRGIVDLVKAAREKVVEGGRSRGRSGTVTVSVNPFVPKPHTPWEAEPMAAEPVLEKRLAMLRNGLGKVGGVKVQTGSVRAAMLDALISLSGRDLSAALGHLPRQGLSFRRLEKAFPGAGEVLYGPREAPYPWSNIRP